MRTRTLICGLLVAALALAGGCGSGAGSTDQVRVVLTPVASPTMPPEALPTLPPVTYVVKPGDTLSGIADLFGVTVDDIVRANNIADPNSLQVGQVLIIPGRAPTPAVTATAPPTGTVTITITATATLTAPLSTPTSVLPPPDVTPPLGPTVDPNAP